MADKWYSSSAIEVYPSAYRGVDSNNLLYNPTSRLNTEENITKAGHNFKDHVVNAPSTWDSTSGDNAYVEMYLYGYYFKFNLKDEFANYTASGEEILWAIIKLKEETIAASATATSFTSRRLINLDDDSAVNLDVDSIFKGIKFTTTTPTPGANEYIFNICSIDGNTFKDFNRVLLDTEDIVNSDLSRLDEKLNTGTINATTIDTTTVNATTIDTNSITSINQLGNYFICSTAADEVNKTIDLTGFNYQTGSSIYVLFEYANDVNNPKLNGYNIFTGGFSTAKIGAWKSRALLNLVFNSNANTWTIVGGDLNAHNVRTTLSTISTLYLIGSKKDDAGEVPSDTLYRDTAISIKGKDITATDGILRTKDLILTGSATIPGVSEISNVTINEGDILTYGSIDCTSLQVHILNDEVGSLSVDGATTLGSTLGVTGATTLSDTLGVTGATTLSSTLGVSGATTLSDTLDVSKKLTVSSNGASITGDTVITGNETVHGKLIVDNVGNNTTGAGDVEAKNVKAETITATSTLISQDKLNVGSNNTVTGTYAAAIGSHNIANASAAFANGEYCTANAYNAHAEGQGTVANSRSQFVIGEYNILGTASSSRGTYVEIVGNGGSNNNRSNARTLTWSGNEWLAGGLTTENNITSKGTLSSMSNAYIYGSTHVKGSDGLYIGRDNADDTDDYVWLGYDSNLNFNIKTYNNNGVSTKVYINNIEKYIPTYNSSPDGNEVLGTLPYIYGVSNTSAGSGSFYRPLVIQSSLYPYLSSNDGTADFTLGSHRYRWNTTYTNKIKTSNLDLIGTLTEIRINSADTQLSNLDNGLYYMEISYYIGSERRLTPIGIVYVNLGNEIINNRTANNILDWVNFTYASSSVYLKIKLNSNNIPVATIYENGAITTDFYLRYVNIGHSLTSSWK